MTEAKNLTKERVEQIRESKGLVSFEEMKQLCDVWLQYSELLELAAACLRTYPTPPRNPTHE